jgi:hypothetical protein
MDFLQDLRSLVIWSSSSNRDRISSAVAYLPRIVAWSF